MGKILRFAIALMFLTISAANTFASDDVDLEKIVITASKFEESFGDTSRKVDVITSKDIQEMGSTDVAEAVSDITSVNISDYGGPGGVKNIRMRGATSAQVQVLIDGRPLNSPRDGEVDLSSIPLDNIDKIEVVHGPVSSLYGSGSMGGTVNIITKKPPMEKQRTEAYSSFGTFRTYDERFSHGARISNFAYLFSGGYKSSAGFRDNTMFDSKDLNSSFDYKINDANDLTLSTQFYKSRTGAPGSTVFFDNDDKQIKLKNSQDLSWNLKMDETFKFQTRLYNTYDRLEFIENTAGSIFDTTDKKDFHTTKTRGLGFEFNKELSKLFQFIGGFNYSGNYNDSTSSAKHKYIVRAWYVEAQGQPWEKLKLNLGARYDDYSNFGGQLNPSFSLLYKINPRNKINLSVARSFRAPTFNDLYWPNDGWSSGNPNLKPEKGYTGEIGYESEINKYLSSSITYYHSKFSQLIIWETDPMTWFSQPNNIGSAKIDGVEFSNKITPFSNFEVDLGYTYLLARDEKTKKFLVYQPRNKLDLTFKFKDIKGVQLDVKGQYTDRRYADAANTVYVKRFFVWGLNVSKKFRTGTTFFTTVNNIFARKYQVINNYPQPGFSITGGLKQEF